MWWMSLLGLVVLAYSGLCLFYHIAQERFIFVRFRVAKRYRFLFPGLFEEVWTEAPDGARLHAIHFKAEDPLGVVLFFHGNNGSLRRWGKYAPRFVGLGYDVLMPDYRGYGKSRGPSSEKAMVEDAQRWYESLKEHWPEEKIVIYGRSLGGAFAVPVAGRHHPRMLILESVFADLMDVAIHYLPILPYPWLLKYRFRNDKAVRGVHCPILMFHGRKDTVVPYTSALKLYAAIPTDVPREMVSFRRGNHRNLRRFLRYQRKVRDALREGGPVGSPTFAPSKIIT